MATEVVMPQMGSDMKEGAVVRWLKAEGDPVAKGESLAEIETDKAVVEIEAFTAGILRKTYVSAGATVPVGHVIAMIGGPEEAVPESSPSGAASPRRPQEVAAAGASLGTPSPPAPGPRSAPALSPRAPAAQVRASPLARQEAEQRGIDLAALAGTGPGGRITREDVLRFAQEPSAAPAARAEAPATQARPVATPGELLPMTRMRQAIARSMTRSKQEIPHVYITTAVDMTAALRLRDEVNNHLEGDARVSINDLVLKAAALALAKHRIFNASFTPSGTQVHPQINIGVAIALDDGLVAPCILECDKKGLAEIARGAKSLAQRARAGGLTAQEFSGATFNVTNLGMFQVESFSAIIMPPQVAALAVGAVRQEAVVSGGQVAVGSVMRLTLSMDHRVADGAQGAAFLNEVRANLEDRARLLP